MIKLESNPYSEIHFYNFLSRQPLFIKPHNNLLSNAYYIMNSIELLEALNVSVSNKANVKCILKKLFNKLDINEINKRILNQTTRIIDIVKNDYSSKKWVETMGYICKISTILKCKPATINKYQESIKELKHNYLSNYNRDRVYIEDTYEEHKDKLKPFLTDEDPIKRRIANLSYFLGGTRKGELLNCVITEYKTIPEDVEHNCFNVPDSKLYIIHHKTKARNGTRIIDIPLSLLKEVQNDLNHYLVENLQTNKPISSNTYQRVFKSMVDINPLDYRHLHAVNNTTKPPHIQQVEANKLGHSLTTSHFIYANGLTNKVITKALINDAKKYYKQLKKEYREQQNKDNKLTLSF